uniref:Uncharacterized LOC101242368 n=1 Tax=Ciona intestinalis TaxID=7719 RepID=F7BBC3_CIOIN|nr:uncharacterized protein LOC101242368 [Ciona intestinalis]|eukprot:XP_004225725.1 uncharacterized protein LOC101242368 [Ciona intestinalis]
MGGFGETMSKITACICAPVFCVVGCIMFMVLPIAMVVIGAIHFHDCPIQHYIPIWLIVAGSLAFLTGGSNCGLSYVRRRKNEESGSGGRTIINVCGGIVAVFNLTWFILGNVWVFSIYPPNTETDIYKAGHIEEEPYCNYIVYYFAYWIIIVSYVLLGIVLLFLFLSFIASGCKSIIMNYEEV